MKLSPEKFQALRIIERKDYASDLWSIRAKSQQKLVFKPGQYATLGVPAGDTLIQRAYSIVSSPNEDELEFFIELVPHGELTPKLYALHPGDTIWMRRQAKGLFTFDERSGWQKHLLLCTVTGVAPYVSMIRTFAKAETEGKPVPYKLTVIQAASRSWEFAYRDELETFARSVNWLRYVPTVSRPWEDSSWTGEVGRVEDILRKYTDTLSLEPRETTAYLCGHPQMIENCKGLLARRGYPKESVREEIYWIPAKTNLVEAAATRP